MALLMSSHTCHSLIIKLVALLLLAASMSSACSHHSCTWRSFAEHCAHMSKLHFAHVAAGVHKTKYWDPVYEDSLDLIAKLPGIAATIYRNTYYSGKLVDPKGDLDWAGNLAVMMGVDAKNTAALDMMRMYQTIHTGTLHNACAAALRRF